MRLRKSVVKRTTRKLGGRKPYKKTRGIKRKFSRKTKRLKKGRKARKYKSKRFKMHSGGTEPSYAVVSYPRAVKRAVAAEEKAKREAGEAAPGAAKREADEAVKEKTAELAFLLENTSGPVLQAALSGTAKDEAGDNPAEYLKDHHFYDKEYVAEERDIDAYDLDLLEQEALGRVEAAKRKQNREKGKKVGIRRIGNDLRNLLTGNEDPDKAAEATLKKEYAQLLLPRFWQQQGCRNKLPQSETE